jgi:hypothetical protein
VSVPGLLNKICNLSLVMSAETLPLKLAMVAVGSESTPPLACVNKVKLLGYFKARASSVVALAAVGLTVNLPKTITPVSVLIEVISCTEDEATFVTGVKTNESSDLANPSAVKSAANEVSPVPPEATANGAFSVAIDPNPKFDLAPAALFAAVPPEEIGKGVVKNKGIFPLDDYGVNSVIRAFPVTDGQIPSIIPVYLKGTS